MKTRLVSSLHALATALNVPIVSFFQRENAQSTIFVTPTARLRSNGNGIVMESLGIGILHQQLEPFLITIKPGAGNTDQPVTHMGEEFVYCLGSFGIRVILGGEWRAVGSVSRGHTRYLPLATHVSPAKS